MRDFITLSEFLLGIPLPPPLPSITLDPKLAEVYETQLTMWSVQGPYMEQLLATWNDILGQPAEQRTELVDARIMNDPNLGPLARQIILAWYTGFHPWAPGQQPTPDPANYEQSLVWALSFGHPIGVPKSFGYWHTAPEET
jgi:hypothetical protein